MITTVTADFGGGKEIVVETGKLAKQANGAVTVQVGGTILLVAAVAAFESREEADFFPLTVDYRDKFYASGRIPGGFFRREGKPADSETLKARLMDRPLRPLFPENYFNEVQVYATVLSYDKENPPEIPAIIGASCALSISDIPFHNPIAAVRIALIGDNFIVNPTFAELEEARLDLIVAGTKDAVTMVESGANEVSEEIMIDALKLAHSEIAKLVTMVEDLRSKCGLEKKPVHPREVNEPLVQDVAKIANEHFEEIAKIYDKSERSAKVSEVSQLVLSSLETQYPEQEKAIKKVFEELYTKFVREKILNDRVRPDGRGLDEIRQITCEVGVLPRAHGSAVFTRGQTQSLGVITLGSPDDKQIIDDLMGESYKRFMLHYNFPSFSVGEVRPLRGPGRREIGHGALAERAITPVIPPKEKFPYTLRVVSEILESNGSSSMASVCSGTLALMDAGVPIKAPVGGIAMGLIMEGDKYAILTDIMGLEDHLGDMDFKVTGTTSGITALQMDIKIQGISFEVMQEALQKAKVAREFIIGKMTETIPQYRDDLSAFAPRIESLKIPTDKIGAVIGPGGKMIKSIVEETGAKIEIEDDGTVYITAVGRESSDAAIAKIKGITATAETGTIYQGKVVRITNFGAFVEILPGKDGLLHISEIDTKRINKVEDVLKIGDIVPVKVLGIDETGKIKLSRKAAMADAEAAKK